MAKRRNDSFVVIGLGTFGYQSATALYEGGAEVLAIDLREDLVQSIAAHVTRAVCADATNSDVLDKLGVSDCDAAIVAIRNRFDTTVLVTHLLKGKGLKRIHVQVDTDMEASAIRAIGATGVVFPERDMAERLAKQLLYPRLSDLLPLGEDFGLVEFPLPKSFVGKNLIQLDVRKRHRVTIVGIKHPSAKRKDEFDVDLDPAPDRPLDSETVLMVLGNLDRLEKFRQIVARGPEDGKPS